MHPTSMANGVHAAQASSSHGRPELYQRGSNESSSLSDFSSHTFAGRHSESNTSLSTFSPPMAPGPSSRPMGTEERPLKQAAYDYFGSADNRISKASLSAWDALADGASHPRSNSVSSLLRSQNSAGTSPTEVNRHGASPSHSQGSGSLPAGASPQSDGSVNYFNAATKLSSAEADNCDTRYHDQSMLINRLKPYYSEKDRPFVALAISQFEALDSFEKMIPSRYLFGSSPGSSGRDPPAHVLLALLAFLAHRALLLPDSMNIEDLDLQAGDLVLRCANNYGRLEGDDRKQMLSFARRSWTLANDLMLQKIRSGDVDPRLIITGMLLEMGAGEDGLSSKGLVQRKMWLFRLAYCWRLHQLDAKPDSESWNTAWDGREVLQKAIEISGATSADDPRAPLPRAADTRSMIKDPSNSRRSAGRCRSSSPPRIGCRRRIFRCPSLTYTRWSSSPPVPTTLSTTDPMDAQGAPGSNGYLTQTRDLIFRTYGRLTRLLHTPLADICTGHSPEPDLQHAITEMETTLDWLMERIGSVTYEGPEMPLRVAAFVHSRIVALLMYRLFISIQAFFFLFPRTHHGQDGQVAAHRFDAHAQGRGALQFRDDRRRQHGARVRERGRRSGGTRLPGAPAVAAAAVYASSDEGVDGGAVGDGWRGQAAAGSASGARRGAGTGGGPVGECAAGGRGREGKDGQRGGQDDGCVAACGAVAAASASVCAARVCDGGRGACGGRLVARHVRRRESVVEDAGDV